MHVRRRAPIMGGTYALWGGTFCCIDLAMYKILGVSNNWNPIISGMGTGALLSWRCKIS